MVKPIVFPGDRWRRTSAEDAGFRSDKLEEARAWLDDRVEDRGYRVVIVRDGKLVAEWNQGLDPEKRIAVASTWKSMMSNVLGIVVAEGKIPSADAEVHDYYPELMDVPEGRGPKEGRYAFPKDRHITFRQLISNTSGYMKPAEEPGKVFHYQTYGMNILSHALAVVYGLYDSAAPEESPGFEVLLREKLADPIGARWEYDTGNFDHEENAHVHVFGYGTRIATTALDLARAGWLWCNYGRWGDTQIVPEDWMRESTQAAAAIKANCPEEEWMYGQGFWSNHDGKLWPELPRDGFHSWGAGGHYVVVFPSLSLVIVQNPDPFGTRGGAGANPELVRLVLDALE